MNVAGTDTGPSNHICAVRWWQSKEGREEIRMEGKGRGEECKWIHKQLMLMWFIVSTIIERKL